MTPSFPKSRTRGFSLIEVLIAVVVVSLGLLALASLQSALIRSASDAKAQSLAMAIAKQKIEQLAAYQTLGGSDNGCVSPTNWAAGSTSCYRAITDEAAASVDVDLSTGAIDDMGGVAFTVATGVTRYVYNVATLQYVSAADTALDAGLRTSPETLFPGKEFKRIVTTVAWTDATGSGRSVQVEDAINGIAPRDSIAIVNNRKSMTARNAESIIVNPGAVAGVIPIAVGNGSNTAASNPTPELKGTNNVIETRFDVFTYIPLTAATALAQSRVETAVVGCRCSTATASTAEEPLRPTYWDGLRYAIPTTANYRGLTTSAPTKNYPLAGPKALVSGENVQSDQCRVCCRDHFDPSGNDANGDARSAVAKFSPRRGSHTHYLVNATNGAQSLVSSGAYSEVCRMIRVDGIFRVAADMNNDYFALLPPRNTGVSSFVPANDVVNGAGVITTYGEAGDYGDMVKKYLKARFTLNNVNTTYNNATSPNPYSNTYVQGTRTGGASSRTYSLNNPAAFYLKLTDDAKWLHARGLYIDYLEPSAIARIDFAKSVCTAADANECVLPYLPFTSINLSELAAWSDSAISPSPVASGTIIAVMNLGFDTASGDVTYTETTGSGTIGSATLSFGTAINSKIQVGMAVSGTGVANNARVVTIAASGRSITVEPTNSAAVGSTIVFQGAPVRGRVTPGSAPSVLGTDASNARATASYNNAAVALKFPVNNDEAAVTATVDNQRFELSAGGTPPDPTAGIFKVDVSSGYTVSPTAPKAYWGIGSGIPSVANDCKASAAIIPYVCNPTSGLGGQMSVLIGSYNVPGTPVSNTFLATAAGGAQPCTYKSGTSQLACPGTLVTGTISRPVCKNYRVSAATSSGILLGGGNASGSAPYNVAADGTGTETTKITFNIIEKDLINLPATSFDTVTLTLVPESSPNDLVKSTFLSCSNQGTTTVRGTVTACTFTAAGIVYAPACQ